MKVFSHNCSLLFFCVIYSSLLCSPDSFLWELASDLGSACWVPIAGMGWSHLDVLRELQPPNTPSSGESKQGKAQVSFWVFREMLDLLWVEVSPPYSALLVVFFPLLSLEEFIDNGLFST